MKQIFLSLLFSLFSILSLAQEKVFFDRNGKSCSEESSFYYRIKENDLYRSYFTNSGNIAFEGKLINASLTNENENSFSGTCTWYHKNGKKKAVRTFSEDGKENGISVYYYESGKIWKELELKNGNLVDGRSVEYDEDGKKSRIFQDDFETNSNDWDLYSSDKSIAEIRDGYLHLRSLSKEGTSRFLSIPNAADDYALECIVNISELRSGQLAGVVFGFKDWDNYNFFFISQKAFYVGVVYEGVKALKADGMYSGTIDAKGNNRIKVITDNGKNYYSINGEIQFTTDQLRNFGSNIGVAVSGLASVKIDKIIFKEIDLKNQNNTTVSNEDMNVKGNGSGFLISKNGYIITNYHVVENATKVLIEVSYGNKQSYNASVIQVDKENDLAIVKINDPDFKLDSDLQYSFKEGGADVGATVFTLGFPMALSGMGREAKFTDGKISSKTGYNNAINTYQTSIPVQPGNSGGPLFNEKGELVGVINAKVTGADNVSYAIKLNYVRNLIELLSEPIEIPKYTSSQISLEEKVRALKNYVVLIKIK